jgi:sulfur relay protein TusB/DsrH
MLHLVFQPSLTILTRLHHQAAVIFLNHATLMLVKDSQWQTAVQSLIKTTPCYVLLDDLALRGMTTHDVIDGLHFVDYQTFVELACQHTPIQSWT